MKRIIFFISTVMFSMSVFSQASSELLIPEAGLNIGSISGNIHTMEDGSYVVYGSAWTAYNDSECMLMKFSASGEYLWSKSYTISNKNDVISGLVSDIDGNLYGIGHFFNSSTSFFEPLFMKFDKDGNEIESKSLTFAARATIGGAIMDSDGNIVAAGTLDNNIVFIKYDTNGDTLFTRYLEAPGDYTSITTLTETVNGYAIAGSTNYYGDGEYDALIQLVDKDGFPTQDANIIGGPQTEHVVGIEEATDGGLVLVVNSESYGNIPKMDHDILFIKTDDKGVVEFTKKVGEYCAYSVYPSIYDDYAYALVNAGNGEYLVAGKTKYFGNGGWEILLYSMNEDGSLNWSKTYGSDKNEDNYIACGTNGDNIIITGYTNGFDTPGSKFYRVVTTLEGETGTPYENDVFLTIEDQAVTENTGTYSVVAANSDVVSKSVSLIDLEFRKVVLEDVVEDVMYKQQIEAEAGVYLTSTLPLDDGYIYSGYYKRISNDYEGFVMRTDIEGNTLWQKSYGTEEYDYIHNLIRNERGYLLMGKTNRNDAGSYTEAFLIQTNFSGDLIWSTSIGVASKSDYFDEGIVTSEGDYLLVGSSYQPAINNTNVLLAKIDAYGDTLWVKQYGDASKADLGQMVAENLEGDFYIVGQTNQASFDNGLYVLKVDADGNEIWTQTYTGNSNEGLEALYPTRDNGFIAVGYTNSFTASMGMIVVKFDENGNIEWSKKMYTGGQNLYARDVKQTFDGGFLIATVASSDNILVVKLDNKGDIVWQKTYLPDHNISYFNKVPRLELTKDKGFIVNFLGNDGYGYKGYVFKADRNGNTGVCHESTMNLTVIDAPFSTFAFTNSVIEIPYNLNVYGAVELVVGEPVLKKSYLDIDIQTLVESIACNGQSNGSIDVTISNGIPSYDVSWSNGSTNQDLSNLTAGEYVITVNDINYCTVTDTINIVEPDQLMFTTAKKDVSCFGGNDGEVSVSASGGVMPYSYHWSNGMIFDTLKNMYAGILYVNVTDNNNCSAATQSVEIIEPNEIDIDFEIVSPSCGMENGSVQSVITGGTSPYTYNWGSAGSADVISDVSFGTYTLEITDENDCVASENVELAVEARIEPVCIVTVDTLSGKNQIVWSQAVNQVVESYNIYKQDFSGVFSYLANIPVDSLSYCLDGTSDPERQADRYKVSVMDTCGNESELSGHHKTLHLNVSLSSQGAGYALTWSHYEGFDFDSYIIYRGESSTGLVPIDTIAYNISSFTYTDNSAEEGKRYYYRVGAVKPTGSCTATKANAGPFSRSLSNLEDNRLQSTGIRVENTQELTIFPNPMNSYCTVAFNNANNSLYQIDVINVSGAVLQSISTNASSVELNRGNLPAGFYILKLTGENNAQKRLIVD